MSASIQTATLDWHCVDGIDVPVSKQFGDVYFSKDNGLLETRHVFLNGNDLPTRLAALAPFEYFCVGETGFGTGLNILALWQLWQQVRPDNQSHLHAISVEKFPLSKTDLCRALRAWPELKPLADALIEQYPLPIAGCHRLNFPNERFSLDLWLGDAHDVFPCIVKTQAVHAWFLDGFAPSCNPELWETQVLSQMIRLSQPGTTFASFSVAGVLKRGLREHGIQISRPRGFGHKREMLKGIWPDAEEHLRKSTSSGQQHFAVIGAGIAGLNCAWALAQRGHQVTIFEQAHPLSGASGNPLALLNPKLCPITQSPDHLMLVCWQYAMRFYQRFGAFRALEVNQIALKEPEQLLALAAQYPEQLLQPQPAESSPVQTPFDALTLTQAGAIRPHQFCEEVLAHPNIHLQIAQIDQIQEDADHVRIMAQQQELLRASAVIVCAARHSAVLFEHYPPLKPIRGQISWVDSAAHPLPFEQAYSYGGYCMQLDETHLILGASFLPQREDDEVNEEDHVHNFHLIHSVFPEYAQGLPPVSTWSGRAGVRAQSPDYFPLAGAPTAQSRLYTLAGLGSKGFMFSPLCSEILAAQILKESCPVPESLFKRLNPQRFKKKVAIKQRTEHPKPETHS